MAVALMMNLALLNLRDCERNGAPLVQAVRPMAWMGRRSSLLARYAVDATRRPVATRHLTEEARAKGAEPRPLWRLGGRHHPTDDTHRHLQLITQFSFRSDAIRGPWPWPRNVRVGKWAAFQLARLGAPGVPHHCAPLGGSDSSSLTATTAPVPPATTALSWPRGLWRRLFQLRLRLGT